MDVKGFVDSAGGGRITVTVNRNNDAYPPVGADVWVTTRQAIFATPGGGCGCRNQWNPMHACSLQRDHEPPCRCQCGFPRPDDLPSIEIDSDTVVETLHGPLLVRVKR